MALHKFIASKLDTTLCGVCKHTAENHVCESCGNTGSLELRYGTMLMCPACCEKEDKAQADNNKPEVIAARLASLPQIAKDIDNSITVVSDIFNAKTVAIRELEAAIEADATITNKPAALAETLFNRFIKFKDTIFELNAQIVDMGNEQKAIQVYMNQLANKLKAEEREKWMIANINYQPTKVKPVKVAPIKTAKAGKIDKAELKKYAAELGISDFTLQMVCVQKGITPEQAANILRKSINEAKSESEPKIPEPVVINSGTIAVLDTCEKCGNTLDLCTCVEVN